MNLDDALTRCTNAPLHRPRGVVQEVVGLIVEVGGLRAAVGDTLIIETSRGEPVEIEVIGFRSGRLVTTPLGSMSGVSQGAPVRHTHRGASVIVSPELLGRVVDAFGQPIDGGPPIATFREYPVHSPPPPAFERRPIDRPFSTGIRAIDGFTPLGIGRKRSAFFRARVSERAHCWE